MSATIHAATAPHGEPERGPIGQPRNVGKQVLLSFVPPGLNEYRGARGAPAAV